MTLRRVPDSDCEGLSINVGCTGHLEPDGPLPTKRRPIRQGHNAARKNQDGNKSSIDPFHDFSQAVPSTSSADTTALRALCRASTDFIGQSSCPSSATQSTSA